MNALDQVLLFERDVASRSRRHRLFIRWVSRKPPNPPWKSVLLLITHLAATTVVFVALITGIWLGSWIFSLMHSIHEFPREVLEPLARLKVFLVYLDILLSGIILLIAVCRYIFKVLRGES